MNDDNLDPRAEPDPPMQLWLMAYADGELDPGSPEYAQVRAWLLDNPQGRAELEEHLRLRTLFEGTRPDRPVWEGVRQSIEARLPTTAAPRSQGRLQPPRSPRLWIALAGFVGSAAAAVLILTQALHRPAPPPPAGLASGVVRVQPGDTEIFGPGDTVELVGESDIEINSMDPADEKALLVGRPPVSWPIELASVGDVVVDDLRTDPGEDRPTFYQPQGGSPMLISPLMGARKE
jgi:anti-sigma factor RsiW